MWGEKMTREEALIFFNTYYPPDGWHDAWRARECAIEALKEQKTGKWINCKYPLGECSECHAIVDIQNNEANYCPVCGSRNRGEEE